jgi:hypothetical protein
MFPPESISGAENFAIKGAVWGGINVRAFIIFLHEEREENITQYRTREALRE